MPYLRPLLLLALLPAPLFAQSADDDYYRAYFLEVEEEAFDEALALYGELLDRSDLSPELRAQVEERVRGCREELACEDFAGLMPASPLLYAELARPGDQLEDLLAELGLLQMAHEAATSGLGVSPALVQGALGLRGAAVAITGIHPGTGQPTGVGVLHPGDLDVVRGLVETALPSGAEVAESVAGYPTYALGNGEAYVTLTSRLVVASTHRREIQRVLDRIHGEGERSLADDGRLVGAMGDRDGALLTVCLNPAPLVPLAKMAAAGDPEAAAIMTIAPPDSLDTVVARLTVHPDVGLELALNMNEGHENLAYHLLRLPPVQEGTLSRVPGEAAAFAALALNDARSYTESPAGDRYVSFLDVGRELFGNVASLALFALPSADDDPAPHGMPRAGAVLTVNDPAESQLVWSTLLGVASLANGGGSFEGEPVDLGGVEARRYVLPEGVAVWGAVAGNELFLATTRGALAASLATTDGAPSVLEEPALASAVGRIDEDTTVTAVFHVGRCVALAADLAPSGVQRAELEDIAPALSRSAGALVLGHGPQRLSATLALSGMPDVGSLVARRMARERSSAERAAVVERAAGEGRWHEALAVLEEELERRPGDEELLERRFDLLAAAGRVDEASAACEALAAHHGDDPLWLNNTAWRLLTEEPYEGHYAGLALALAERANELTSHSVWTHLDTLALAAFESGDVERAIELGEQALQLVGDDGRRAEVERSLERFRSAEAPRGQPFVYSVF